MGTLKKDIEERIRGLTLTGCQVILIKEQYVYNLLRTLKIELPQKVGIMLVRDFGDLRTLDESALNRLGYFKKETSSEQPGDVGGRFEGTSPGCFEQPAGPA